MSLADYIKDPGILWRRKCAQVIDQVAYINGGTSSGSSDSYVLNLEAVNGVKPPVRLIDGARITFRANFTNATTTPTVTVSEAIGSKSIAAEDGIADIEIGDIVGGYPVDLEWRAASNSFRLLNPKATVSNKESILQFNNVFSLISTTSTTAVVVDSSGDNQATQSIELTEGDKFEIEFSYVYSNSTAVQEAAIQFYNATDSALLDTFRSKNIAADASGYESHASFKKTFNVAASGGDITPGTKTIDVRWFTSAGTIYMSNYYYKLRTYRVN